MICHCAVPRVMSAFGMRIRGFICRLKARWFALIVGPNTIEPPVSKSILIIGPAWVGDMVMAQTLFLLLKHRHGPECQIDVLAPDWTRALLSRMPQVGRSIDMPLKHGELGLVKRFQLGKQLRASHYDQAIVLPNSFKSALVPFFARIPVRTGWMRECRYGLLNDWRPLDKHRYPLMIERFMALALPKKTPLEKPYPCPQLVIDEKTQQSSIEKHQLNLTAPILACCIGAEFGPSKRWSPEYFADIAVRYIKQGYQVWLFGSPKEREIAAQIQGITKNACVDLTGKTSLAEAIDLLALSQKVLANDSGLMHIACALQKPTVAIYGSTSPAFTPPLGKQTTISQLNLPCQPCFKRVCPLGHGRCLKALTPDIVEKALNELDKK
jgi:heptosyltransferase II